VFNQGYKIMTDYLGGHVNVTKLDIPVFEQLVKDFSIDSMVDVGCGPGGMKTLADQHNVFWYGVEGDAEVMQTNEHGILWDLTKGVPPIQRNFTLGWSTEFLEHIYAEYIPNFLPIFQKCKIVCCSGALPGVPGHHHVNCQPTEYWVDVFDQYGFDYDVEYTDYLRSISVQQRLRQSDGFTKIESRRKQFFKNSGMFFVNRNNDL
jgi:hypothetical protein